MNFKMWRSWAIQILHILDYIIVIIVSSIETMYWWCLHRYISCRTPGSTHNDIIMCVTQYNTTIHRVSMASIPEWSRVESAFPVRHIDTIAHLFVMYHSNVSVARQGAMCIPRNSWHPVIVYTSTLIPGTVYGRTRCFKLRMDLAITPWWSLFWDDQLSLEPAFPIKWARS